MPNSTDIMKRAFRDELEKISFTRSGRKPIGIERLMERETEPTNTPSNAFTDAKVSPEVFKADIEKISGMLGKHLPGVIVGSVGTLAAQKANRDRQLGKQMRLQQQQGY